MELLFELCPYGIWNFGEGGVMTKKIGDLNFVPMGFETSFLVQLLSFFILFELCPYGIWNFSSATTAGVSNTIWTLSLWDLKRTGLPSWTILPSIWTLSLWDLKRFTLSVVSRFLMHLNFVPMGFETKSN